jgi:hypothetical protein
VLLWMLGIDTKAQWSTAALAVDLPSVTMLKINNTGAILTSLYGFGLKA